MMGDLQHVHRQIMTLDAPIYTGLYDDTVVHSSHSFAPYQPLPTYGVPSMSWSATDPALLLNEQSSGKLPLSWQSDVSCLQQTMQYSHAGCNGVGQLDMMAAVNADPYNPSINELTQWFHMYSLQQMRDQMLADHFATSNLSYIPDTSSLQSGSYLLPTSSECLHVVSCSGSDSLSTTETWKSETSGGCAPNYDNVLANLNEPSSVTLVRETRDTSFQPQRQQLDIFTEGQAVKVHSVQDCWPKYNLSEPIGVRSDHLLKASALTHEVTTYDVLPVTSSADRPAFKRQRTWDEALQQGSLENEHLRYTRLASTAAPKIDFSVRPLSVPELSRETRTPCQQSPFQGKFSANHLVGGDTSAYSRGLDLQEEGRLLNGKPAVTSVEPQSVAARHRRKRISERIRVLEKLIPGGNKMDTATMLDEAIEYVKFLQLQVQILENDSLEDIPVTASTQSLSRKSSISGMDKHGRLKRKVDAGSGGDLSAALSLRAGTSPLILSEVLQQQLFKQKLCLVSIRQCPSRTASAQAIAPSILRNK